MCMKTVTVHSREKLMFVINYVIIQANLFPCKQYHIYKIIMYISVHSKKNYFQSYIQLYLWNLQKLPTMIMTYVISDVNRSSQHTKFNKL